MMEDYFLIPIMDIDPDWSRRGFHHHFYALDYCKQILKIPYKHIAKSTLCSNGLEIQLKEFESVRDEEWYLQLINLEKSSKRC